MFIIFDFNTTFQYKMPYFQNIFNRLWQKNHTFSIIFNKEIARIKQYFENNPQSQLYNIVI